MNQRYIIIGFISLIILSAIVLTIIKLKNSKNQVTDTVTCNCGVDEICNPSTGECTSKNICPDLKTVPSDEHCSDTNTFICENGEWHCNGVCDSGWYGTRCKCSIDELNNKPITSICNNLEIPVCDNITGNIDSRKINNCSELSQFLDVKNLRFNDICGKDCPSGDIRCLDTSPPTSECIDKCPTKPSDSDCTECLPKCDPTKDQNCKSDNVCVCGSNTMNKWKCEKIANTTSSCTTKTGQITTCCPPLPEMSYCKDTNGEDMPLNCMPCGSNGFIRYCSGSNIIPKICLENNYQVTKDKNNIWRDGSSDGKPVFPTKDNSICKLDNNNSPYSSLPTDVGLGYLSFDNKDGHIISNSTFIPYSSSTPGNYYYIHSKIKNPDDTSLKCLWEDYPLCENNSVFVQNCKLNNGDINKCDPRLIDNGFHVPLKNGYCDCTTYNYNGVNTKYVGDRCQYSNINNCSNNGTVDSNGKCTCTRTYTNNKTKLSKTYVGDKCQYDDNTNCSNGNGNVDYNGICATCNEYISSFDGQTKKYVGNKCQYNDNDTCSGTGNAKADGTCDYSIKIGNYIIDANENSKLSFKIDMSRFRDSNNINNMYPYEYYCNKDTYEKQECKYSVLDFTPEAKMNSLDTKYNIPFNLYLDPIYANTIPSKWNDVNPKFWVGNYKDYPEILAYGVDGNKQDQDKTKAFLVY